MRSIIFLSALLLGCPEQVVDTQPLVQEGEPPSVQVDEPVEIQPGVVLVAGMASDAQDPATDLLIELHSSVDDLLWSGSPSSDGCWSWQGPLTPGEHTLSITVYDTEGHEATVQYELRVRGENHAPTCEILYPMDGFPFETGDSIYFKGKAEDEDGDELLLLWSSDLQGSLFMGETFEIVLEQGQHLITFEVSDDYDGLCTDQVTISVGD